MILASSHPLLQPLSGLSNLSFCKKAAPKTDEQRLTLRDMACAQMEFLLYVSLFEEGNILKAYEAKLGAIQRLAFSQKLEDWERWSVNLYSSLMWDLNLDWARDIGLPKVNADDLLKAPAFKPGDGHVARNKIIIKGPFASEIPDSETSDVLLIKPQPNELATRKHSNILAYYNRSDYAKFNDEIHTLLDSFLVDRVLTPNRLAQVRERHLFCPDFELMKPIGIELAILKIYFAVKGLGYSKIYFSGFPFYVGEDLYPPGYRTQLRNQKSGRIDQGDLLSSLRKHDVLFNFLILSYLWRRKKFSCDKMLEKVLLRTPRDFIESLELSINK